MKYIEIKIRTINPIIIAENSGDSNMLISKDYIHGSSLLGIFAGKYIEKNKLGIDAHKDNNFNSWFLNGDIIFSDLFIFDKKRYYPNPLSIRKEKHNENQIYDLLFVDDEFEKQTKIMSPFSKKVENYISKIEVKKEISFHHARNWDTGASQKGVIFNYEHIKENQIFVGNIIGEESKIDDFHRIFTEKFIARVGKSKNSQYGKIEIELSEPKNYEQELKTDFETDDDIVMTCLSDTIIYNEYGFSTTNISDISKELGVKIGKAFLKKSRNEQFVGIWKLKKQSENLISAGSCFLLKNLPKNYKELQQIGFGERTNEGFGRVVLGYQTDDEIKYFDNKEDRPSKPKTEIPEYLKNLTKNIVIEKLYENEKKKAMMQAYEFMNKESRIRKLPSKSLLGKLQLMTRDIENFESNFEKVVKNKPAKQQLEKSNNGNNILLKFIREQSKLNNSINIPSDIENFLKDIDTSLKDDEKLKTRLKQKFLGTFFNSLRKREVKK